MASAGHGLVPSGKADDIRLVIDAIPGLVKPAREDGSTKFSHQRRIESSWFSFKQGLNRGRKDATNPDDFPRIVWTFQKTLTFGPPFDVERRFLRSNGEAQLGNEIAIKTCHEPVKARASSIPVTHLKAEKYARLQSQKVDKLIRRKEHGKPKECNPG